MAVYSKPKVTIDLDEYQELQKYRDFKLNSKDLTFYRNPKTNCFDLILKDDQVMHSSIGVIQFLTPDLENQVLKNWVIKFIKKP